MDGKAQYDQKPPKLKLSSIGGVSVSEDQERIHVHYDKPVPVSELLPTIAMASGKVAVAEAAATGVKVTVTFAEPLPKEEAYVAIVAALQEQGLEVDDSGEKIVIKNPKGIKLLQSLRGETEIQDPAEDDSLRQTR
jgi:hypothetical protein